MEILRKLNAIANSGNKKFVLIGGHAVSAHGFVRSTKDLDICIPQEDCEWWKSKIMEMKYNLRQQTKSFLQFAHPDLFYWPIDLMLVNNQTFDKIYPSAISKQISGVATHIASIETLVAMKLFAIKQNPTRKLKDMLDIEKLIEAGQLDIRSKNIIELFQKYDSMLLYEEIKANPRLSIS